ncbi:MAG: glycosyltransferase family 39 protein [Alphaproteobacteria bacterium]|nr:glycosyltransferase family 39 protein [Alphaproteobacteria bacterium]
MRNPLFLAAGGILLLTVWRVLSLAYFFPFDLYGDEAQYWEWSLNPSFGYYSKPPMVAWAIAASTSLCGDSEFCIRLPALLAQALTACVIYALVRALAPQRPFAATASALAYATLPAVTLSSHIVSTDPFLMLFWACSMLCMVHALAHPRWWLAAGIAAGLAMLSKYNAVMLGPCALLALWFLPRHRHHLRSPWLWGGVALAALVFLPNLLWNAQHAWVSARHTGDNASLYKSWGNPAAGFEFLGAQALVIGPVLFGGLVWALARWREAVRDESLRFLLCFTVPWLSMVLTLAFLTRAHANWGAPAYVAGTALAAVWLMRRPAWLYAALALNVAVMLAFPGAQPLAKVIGVTRDPFERLAGWREVADAVAKLQAAHPGTIVLVDSRMLFAELSYYMTPRPYRNLAKWDADNQPSDQYDMVAGIERHQGKNFLMVTESSSEDMAAVLPHFGASKQLEDLSASRRYHVYLLQDYLGRDVP